MDGESFIPSKNLYLPVDAEQVIKTGTVPESRAAEIVPRIDIPVNRRLTKSDMMVLEMLRTNQWKRPIRITSYNVCYTKLLRFLGGDLMQAQGGKLIRHYKDMAFMGFIPIIMNAGKISQNMKDCKAAILDFKPDVVIMIDYPSFNLRIARFVKENSYNFV